MFFSLLKWKWSQMWYIIYLEKNSEARLRHDECKFQASLGYTTDSIPLPLAQVMYKAFKSSHAHICPLLKSRSQCWVNGCSLLCKLCALLLLVKKKITDTLLVTANSERASAEAGVCRVSHSKADEAAGVLQAHHAEAAARKQCHWGSSHLKLIWHMKRNSRFTDKEYLNTSNLSTIKKIINFFFKFKVKETLNFMYQANAMVK